MEELQRITNDYIEVIKASLEVGIARLFERNIF